MKTRTEQCTAEDGLVSSPHTLQTPLDWPASPSSFWGAQPPCGCGLGRNCKLDKNVFGRSLSGRYRVWRGFRHWTRQGHAHPFLPDFQSPTQPHESTGSPPFDGGLFRRRMRLRCPPHFWCLAQRQIHPSPRHIHGQHGRHRHLGLGHHKVGRQMARSTHPSSRHGHWVLWRFQYVQHIQCGHPQAASPKDNGHGPWPT